jgi:hypothetical protein
VISTENTCCGSASSKLVKVVATYEAGIRTYKAVRIVAVDLILRMVRATIGVDSRFDPNYIWGIN